MLFYLKMNFCVNSLCRMLKMKLIADNEFS